MQKNKVDIEKLFICPQCHGSLNVSDDQAACEKCGQTYSVRNGVILFTEPPENIQPSEFRERGKEKDTAWRQANSLFLEKLLRKVSKDSLILDVGAGRGDFLSFYADFPHILVDIYPYPEVDLVCDLTQMNPCRKSSVDVILLMNVLEHVKSPLALLQSMHETLKPGGKIFIAIPFYLKIHQAPLDFQRLTHFALCEMAEQADYSVEFIEGFYDPCGVIDESLRYYRFWGMSKQSWLQRKFSRLVLLLMNWMTALLRNSKTRSYLEDPYQSEYPAPTGYQIVLTKGKKKQGQGNFHET